MRGPCPRDRVQKRTLSNWLWRKSASNTRASSAVQVAKRVCDSFKLLVLIESISDIIGAIVILYVLVGFGPTFLL
jgi:hypothetical protein